MRRTAALLVRHAASGTRRALFSSTTGAEPEDWESPDRAGWDAAALGRLLPAADRYWVSHARRAGRIVESGGGVGLAR